jgi:KUP system potassium uptake protein
VADSERLTMKELGGDVYLLRAAFGFKKRRKCRRS